eukprot:3054793-Pleurochrysis_carterae.AAC.2
MLLTAWLSTSVPTHPPPAIAPNHVLNSVMRKRGPIASSSVRVLGSGKELGKSRAALVEALGVERRSSFCIHIDAKVPVATWAAH